MKNSLHEKLQTSSETYHILLLQAADEDVYLETN